MLDSGPFRKFHDPLYQRNKETFENVNPFLLLLQTLYIMELVAGFYCFIYLHHDPQPFIYIHNPLKQGGTKKQ